MSFPIIPKLNSAPGAGAPATLTLGELAANRSTAKLYLGTDTGVQELAFAGSLGGTAISAFTAAGGTSFAPINGYTTTNVNAYLVSVGGIEQRPTVDWTISSEAGGTVIFATAPPSGVTIVVRAVVAGSGGGGGGTDIGGRAWSSAATYTEGDLVATDQTSTWICIQADNTNHEPSASPTWWARMPASAVQLQFRPLAETAPTDGQAIVWDEVNTTWAPAALSARTSFGTIGSLGESATGAVRFGDDSFADTRNIAIGYTATSGGGSGLNNIAIGTNSISTSGNSSIAIGTSASAAYGGIAIGEGTTAYNGAVTIGPFSLDNMKSKINELVSWANSNGASITPL